MFVNPLETCHHVMYRKIQLWMKLVIPRFCVRLKGVTSSESRLFPEEKTPLKLTKTLKLRIAKKNEHRRVESIPKRNKSEGGLKR